MGANIRLRAGKSRIGGEENRSQGSPSALANGEECGNGIDSSKN